METYRFHYYKQGLIKECIIFDLKECQSTCKNCSGRQISNLGGRTSGKKQSEVQYLQGIPRPIGLLYLTQEPIWSVYVWEARALL